MVVGALGWGDVEMIGVLGGNPGGGMGEAGALVFLGNEKCLAYGRGGPRAKERMSPKLAECCGGGGVAGCGWRALWLREPLVALW